MDISRFKKVFAGTFAAAITLSSVSSVFAAYSDVPSGVWYEDAVNAFTDAGYLDSSQTKFRGSDNANRAEFTKLVVELNGGVLSTAPAVPSFDDVKPGTWYFSHMEEAAKEGWIKGDKDCYGSHPCYARPGANINRAEAAAIIVRAFGLQATGAAPSFVDVPAGQWYTDAIQTAADHCVLQGDDATSRVRPGDNMNRAEMVTMLHRVDMNQTYGVDCGTGAPEPTAAGISSATATSATKLEVVFNTAVDATAAADKMHYKVTGAASIDVSSVKVVDSKSVELMLATAMTANDKYTVSVQDMKDAKGGTFSDTANFTGYSPIVMGNGTLEVAMASSNPVGDSVPKGANGVVMLSLALTASCDDAVSLEHMVVLHEGFGTQTDIDGLYASVDGTRLTRKRSVDSQDQTADLRFKSPLQIPACGTKTVDIIADFSSTSTTSAEHNLAVELPTDFHSNAKAVQGNFPLRGNTFRLAAVTSGQVTVSYRTISPDKVEVGDKNVVLGKFELSTNSVEDQTIYSVTLEQNSTVSDGDITNLKVRRTDGTVLTNVVPSFVGDFATFVFDPPFTILQGDKITLEVVGDVAGGADKSVIIHFEESSDLFAVGSLYGYGVNGQLYGSQVSLTTETTTLPDTVTIDAGQFTIEIDGPVQQKYTRDTKDAVLANILITTGGETVDIKKLFIAVQGQTSTGGGLQNLVNTNFDNIHEILEGVQMRNTVTGQTISAVRLTATSEFGTGTASTSTYQLYRFDDFVATGKETWQFRVDFINNGSSNHPTSGDRFRIHICGEPKKILDSNNALTSNTTGCDFGGIGSFTTSNSTAYQMDVEGLSTGDKVGDVRPRGTITGNFHRIANSQMTVAVKGIGTGDTAVKNSKNITLLRFEARAGEAKDVLFTKSLFKAESGSLLNGQNYALWVDTDGDSVVDTKLQDGVASQSSRITFDKLAGGGYLIPAQQTVVFEVHSDIAASLTNSDLLLMFDTGSSVTYLEAEQADDGSNLSGINTNGTCSATCDIIVTTTRSKLWTLASQGSLFVTKDSVPVRARQLLGGTLGDPVLRLQLRAQDENVDVTDIQFNSSGSTATSVDRLELYKEGDTAPFTTASVGSCGNDDVLTVNGGNGGATIVAFCAKMQSSQLVVTKGQNLKLIVRPRMKDDNAGATSNQIVQLWITRQAIVNNTSGSGAIRARGALSSNDLIANSGDTTANGEIFIGTDTATTNSDIVGNVNRSVLSKVVTIADANPDSGLNNGSPNVPVGVSPFGQFRFTAATNTNSLNGLNKFTLSGVIFSINATNVNMDATAFKIYNKNDASTKANCKARSTTGVRNTNVESGSFLVDCDSLMASSVDTHISSGDSLTFVLEGSVTNAKVSSSANSTLQASIQNFTSSTVNAYGSTASTLNNIEWADQDTTSTFFYWIEYPDTVVKSTSYKS